MKVLFQTRVDLFTNRGGDTIQVEKTCEELKKLGVDVDISAKFGLDLSKYDLVHIFQLDWTCEPYLQILNAKKQGKKVILSPIHHSEQEVVEFEKNCSYGLRKIVRLFFKSLESLDVLKNIYRSFMDVRKMYPTFLSIKDGYRNQQKKVIELSDMVLVQTDREANDIKDDYKIDFEWRKVALGVGDVYFDKSSEKWIAEDDYVVVVGRIEPRKNQLRIIEAYKKLRYEGRTNKKLVIIGAFNKNNLFYYLHFLLGIRKYSWVYYVPKVDYLKMPSVYKLAKVCVSASFFETTGLTLLEAALSGCCNVVARNGSTGERVKEYLGENVTFCDPYSIDSIRDAIKLALESKRPCISDTDKKFYTWSNVASNTLKVYNEVLR